MTTQERVRQFILETYYVADPETVADDVSLIDSGLIDSTGVLELVDFLEESFDIEVEDSELVPENLDSIANLTRYLATKGVLSS